MIGSVGKINHVGLDKGNVAATNPLHTCIFSGGRFLDVANNLVSDSQAAIGATSYDLVGSRVLLNGGTSRILWGPKSYYNVEGDMSLVVFFTPNSVDTGIIINIGGTVSGALTSNTLVSVSVVSSTIVRYIHHYGTNTTFVFDVTIPSIVAGNLMSIAVTRNSSTRTVEIWVNGVSQGTTTYASFQSPDIGNGVSSVRIGNSPSSDFGYTANYSFSHCDRSVWSDNTVRSVSSDPYQVLKKRRLLLVQNLTQAAVSADAYIPFPDHVRR